MLYRKVLAPILFALSESDAEKAHDLTIRAMKWLQNDPLLLHLIAWWYCANKNPNPVEVAGIQFPNRVGLAAGFDKHAEILPYLQALGFGFLELGTILPRPQSGNERPRQFRIPEDETLINRNGFNSHGCEVVAGRLRSVRPDIHIPIGISCGKMKDTPLENAAEDYVEVATRIGMFGAYIVINVSSPNTPGLRELQGRAYMEDIVHRVVTCAAKKPVFVKISPDLSEAELAVTLEAVTHGGGAGIIVGNTTTDRPRSRNIPFSNQPSQLYKQPGGLSGRWLEKKTLGAITNVRRLAPLLPIIGVGGTYDRESAQRKIDAGASLVQLLTGLVYGGPNLITQCRSIQ